MPEYWGSCHCGAVAFRARGELTGLEVCNCSICDRTGYVHWYVSPDDFELLRGRHSLETYRFGTRTAQHHFCRTCGVSPFRVPRSDPDKIDVNARCLEDVDANALEARAFDGRNWERAMRERER